MKQTAFAAFIAFWTASFTLLAVSVLTPAVVAQNEAVYSLEQVAGHNRIDDCWMIIEGKVYDLTDYIPGHPAPPQILVPWCGKEATEGMRTKGYGRNHSPNAWQMLQTYEIGILEQ